MRKNRVLYLVVMITVLGCGLWGGRRLALLITALLAVLLAASAAGLYLFVRGMAVSLKGKHSCYSGQELRLCIRLRRPAFCFVGSIRMKLLCKNYVFTTEKETLYVMEPGRGRLWEYDVYADTADCGERVFWIEEMQCGDLLGLFHAKISVKEELRCVVYPYDAQIYASLRRQIMREQIGEIYDAKRSGTDVSEVFGLREYREGDPLQSIHWKLSGKLKQLIVREFGRPVNYQTLILLAPALRYGAREVSAEVVNGVFDLGVSFSHALVNQNIPHYAGYLLGEEICCMPVDSVQSYETVRNRLMNLAIPENGDRVLLSFLNQQLYKEYTKIVYVSGAVDETTARSLFTQADLMILQAVDGPSGHLIDRDGYEVISISTEKIRSMEHVIPL